MKNYIVLLALPMLLFGCDALMGEEVARLPINKLSTEDSLIVKEVTLDLKKGDEIAIWSDMDMEYEGDVALRFRMEMLKNGERTGGMELDPTNKNITMGEFKTVLNGKTDWSFSGKNGEVTIDEDGKYTFKAILIASDNPSLKLEKAELVLKK